MDNGRVILHADLNSFFATAEQQANPRLRGKPVGVVKAVGRSCIIAASVEAKRMGVGTGSRTYEARKLCPNIILVPADFAKYEDISRRFIKICQTYSPACEVFSLDECFLDVTDTEKFWGNAFNIAFEIKGRLRAVVGDYMTCSVGISHNRLLAKLASEQIKPDGLFWITKDNMLEVLDRSDLMDVCGLGWGLWRHLLDLGISDFAKLRSCTLPFLHQNFGPYWSVHLYNISRGIDSTPVLPIENIADAKSVGRTYTTHKILSDKADIWKVVRNLCEEAAAKARVMGLTGRYVGLAIRGGRESNQSFWGHMTLQGHIDDGKTLYNICRLICENWDIREAIFCGVTLGMLTKKSYTPTPLFGADRKRANLIKGVDRVNNHFGDYTVFPAQLLGMQIVMPEVTGFFGDKKFRLNFLRN